MSFPVEIWLRGDHHATTHMIAPDNTNPGTWSDSDVASVLVEMLRALDRAQNPETVGGDRPIALRGFSWIVNPFEGGVLIALEMSLGAAVAGPFDVPERQLTEAITRVMHAQRADAETVH